MAESDADKNLLFGILALQMDFISRDQLVAAMNAWVLRKGQPLAEILQEQQVLGNEERILLDALLCKHLERHSNNAEKSLNAVSSIASIRDHLKSITDPDLMRSLGHVSAARGPDDEYRTQPYQSLDSIGDGSRFRILRPHARGGLGEVFVARDEELGREVALKQIQDKHADELDSRSRFVLEAQVTGGLEHPGIVPVYGLGAYADGRPYYAMRFIRGDSLQDALSRFHSPESQEKMTSGERTLGLRQLLGRVIDVCNAIEYAHSRGVLHRDLKPGNIMLGKYGETLVVDWGLAKAQGCGQSEPSVDREHALRPTSASSFAATQMGARSALQLS